MLETIDDLTISYSEGGIDLVKELDKVVLTRGAWVTLLFRYQEWDARRDEYGPIKFTIRRYQKRNEKYTSKSKFNISSDQARKMVDILSAWLPDE